MNEDGICAQGYIFSKDTIYDFLYFPSTLWKENPKKTAYFSKVFMIQYSPLSRHPYFQNNFSFILSPRTKVFCIIYTFLSPFIFLLNLHYPPSVSYFFRLKHIYPCICVEWKEEGGGFLLLAATGVIVKLYCFSDSPYGIFIMKICCGSGLCFVGPLGRIRIVIFEMPRSG